MIRTSEQLFLAKMLGWVALIATLAITPEFSVDPINLSKLAIISLGGIISLAIAATQLKVIFTPKFRLPIFVVLTFILNLVLVLVFAGNNFNQEFYGTFGRATGFVAYVSLAGLLIAGIIAGSSHSLKRFSWFLITTGAFSMAYGLIQALGADPVNWAKGLNPVIGFVGNPNFQSSFVAFSAIAAFAILIGQSSARIKVGLTVFVAFAIFIIYKTQSQQGFVVLAGGIAVILFLFVNKSKAKKLTFPMLGAGFVGVLLAIMGSLNKGPLAAILFEESVTYRGDYWHAGWKMTVDNPIFGIGLDNYGDWYRRSRTLEATLRRGPEVVSNAAHNVLLDFSSGGGFPLAILYLAMMLLVLVAAIRIIRRSSNFEPYFSGLFAMWVAYQAQSLISLNQLGLAVWGWIVSGLIIGWEIYGRSPENEIHAVGPSKSSKRKVTNNNQQLLPSTSLAIFVGLLIGSLLGIPPLLASGKFKSALESNNASLIVNSANSFPQDGYRAVQIGYVLHQNKLDAQALPILLDATKKYPDVFDAWKILAILTTATPAQVSEAKSQMKRLDPFNPDLK
jgi:O-antigen ligase